MRIYNTERFIENAKKVHNNFYTYVAAKYIGSEHKLIITCPIHGQFKQTPHLHLAGRGCGVCGTLASTKAITQYAKKKCLLAKENFVNKANLIHGIGKYGYEKVNYINARSIVDIWCSVHQKYFHQTPDNHLHKRGCPDCKGLKIAKSKLSNSTMFIKKAKLKHGNKYGYEKVKYVNNITPVNIWCHIHQEHFRQSPSVHLDGSGCPRCKSSKGELIIEKFLKDHNINYIRQKRFKDCKDKKPLPFDFEVETRNQIFLIEYHGEQHYHAKTGLWYKTQK